MSKGQIEKKVQYGGKKAWLDEKRCLIQMRKGQIEKKSPIWKG